VLRAEAVGFVEPAPGDMPILIDFYGPEEFGGFLFFVALMVPVMGVAASIPAMLLGSSRSDAFVRAVIAHGAVNGSLLILAYLTGGLYLTYLVAHTAIAAVITLLPAARSASHLVVIPGAGIILISLIVDVVRGDPFLDFYWLAPFLFSVLVWVVLSWQAGRILGEQAGGRTS
jgi:hypothetical protein